jgi:hypothetical protein
MSVAAASRIHYWKHHPEIMLGKRATREWAKKAQPKAARRSTGTARSKKAPR